jgi:ferritin
MLSKTIQDALNNQINHELYSAYLYLSMAAHFESENLPGFAHWMIIQYQEETSHAMKFYKYVHDRSGTVTLKAIDQPPTKFSSPLKIFEQVLKHEQKVSGLINTLFELAVKTKDYPTQVLLQWFITEQVEEEKNDIDIINQLKLAGDTPAAVMLIDRQLGARKADS